MSSGSDIPDDWENESIESEKPLPQEAPKKVAQETKVGRREYQVPAELSKPLDDPDAEAQRRKLLQEHRDMFLGGDLFGCKNDEEIEERSRALLAKHQTTAKSRTAIGTEGDYLERIQVTRLAEIETLCDALDRKIAKSPAKSGCWLRMLDRILAACASKMEPKDLKTLERKIVDLQKRRTTEKHAAQTSSKKGTDLKVNILNYADELAIFDGEDGDSEDDAKTSEDDEGIM
eukprot:Gregarina_sp_Poly_1__10991@NODE_871_length_5906_cov_137_109437_g620_i1_p3_GENE_NODE_871_length_5906_cov_137_109437_g620_i1NODE_871_length_5906_cov_137_109437_g620_i1_p3_ORF_typecomplete_len254_score69_73eIF3_subunit/PF08597_10/5_3e16USP8_interact/PF08941_10/0_00071DUF5403/PF17395_2/0_7DUF5403/PF17395_2/5_7e02_NODE_871_length_5906_cov_137_109437_g620_i151445839